MIVYCIEQTEIAMTWRLEVEVDVLSVEVYDKLGRHILTTDKPVVTLMPDAERRVHYTAKIPRGRPRYLGFIQHTVAGIEAGEAYCLMTEPLTKP